MSTKYILHGGDAQDKTEENQNFFREILADYTHSAHILLVQFAATPENQDTYRGRHISQFEDVRNGRDLQYQVADEEKFIEQVKWADVVYICGASGGGATIRLLETMNTFDGLKELFTGKTIAGESAGANCLASLGYSKSKHIVIHGLGLVPVKVSIHYEPGDEKALENIGGNLESVYLKHYQFRVFNL